MHAMTKANLEAAFAGESQAHMKYMAFAAKAEQEGLPEVARLFRAISYAEQVHATNHLTELNGIGSTAENLETAFQKEIKANVDEYPKLIKDAAAEAHKAALKAFSQSRDVESFHAQLYKRAINDMVADRETDYYVCQVCGYINEDGAPDKCPVCGAVPEKFKQVG